MGSIYATTKEKKTGGSIYGAEEPKSIYAQPEVTPNPFGAFEAREPSILERITSFFKPEPQQPIRYDLPGGRKYQTLPPTREEKPLTALKNIGGYYTSRYITGRGLYLPDIVTRFASESKSFSEALNKETGFVPTKKEQQIGSLLDFMGSIRTAGGLIRPGVAKLPIRALGQRVIGGGLTFGARATVEQAAKKITKDEPMSPLGIAFETAIGMGYGLLEGAVARVKSEVAYRRFIKAHPEAKAYPKKLLLRANEAMSQWFRGLSRYVDKVGKVPAKHRDSVLKLANRIKRIYGKDLDTLFGRMHGYTQSETQLAIALKEKVGVSSETAEQAIDQIRKGVPIAEVDKALSVAKVTGQLPVRLAPKIVEKPPEPPPTPITAEIRPTVATKPPVEKAAEVAKEKMVTVYRGITGKEGDRFLVTRDRSVAESHSKIVESAQVPLSSLKSGDEELGFYAEEVPPEKVGEIEAWISKKDFEATAPTPEKPPTVAAGATKTEQFGIKALQKTDSLKGITDEEAHNILRAQGIDAQEEAVKQILRNRGIDVDKIDIPPYEIRGALTGAEEARPTIYGRKPSHQEAINLAVDEAMRDVTNVIDVQMPYYEPAKSPVEKAELAREVKTKHPEAQLSRSPVTVEGKKYYPVALPTDQISVDAAKFQFKLGAKLVGGVTEALKGVEKFDPVKGGQILVWQDKAGKYWVVDGHHRVALARKTGAETLETWVVSEKDGVTEQDARAIGALRNLADGKGTAVDAAKLFRDSDITLAELRKNAVPTESTVVQQGLDMADLSDEVFRLVIDERLPANMAATIGKQVKNPIQQKQVADLILEGEVETLRQAELLAATIDSAPILTKTEQTLFGLETTEKSLYAERAKVLANVEKKLKTNKKVFGVLATQTGIIEAKGNILAKVENLATKEKAEEVLFMLEKLANSKGPIAEALNDATKQYAENPTKENLSKVTSELLEKWTEGPGRLRVPERQALPELPLERVKPKVKGKPGFVDVRPLEKALVKSLKVVEPAKITERAFGKKPGAIIIKGIHQADVGRIEFNEAEIEALDSNLVEFGEKLSRYSNKVLKNLMASRGKPVGAGAVLVKNEALKALAKEAPELVGVRKMITKIADHNYKYLQSVVGDDIHYVEDYYYGIFKDTEKATVENFLDYWHTTDRFTKQKKLPTVADAIAFGLDLRDYNPVNNLRSEYMAIARLDGMIYMRDELMRTGKGRYIDIKEEAPHDWEKIKEPVFKDVRVHPEAAVMIKSLLSTNKLRRHWALRGLTHTNNALRTLKFMFSMFHQLNIAKQSVADEGYLKFLQPSATRGITRGFKKSDPIFRTPAYKDYIRHGGGHRYSIESQAERAISNFVESLDKRLGFAFKVGALPIRIPKAYVKWLFQSYIPKVKYSKYLDSLNKFEGKNGRTPTSVEKIEILKEQQNFYGMMNERLFGRSGTVTSLMRLWYMSPGYFEGNFRSILKAILQWGGKVGHRANRSRSNIINSLILSGIVATVTTLIMTGKPPKKPETREDLRDLFKGDTGKVDDKGRKIMVDFLTYDKDYWNILGQTLIGKPGKAAEAVIKRGAGMVAPSAQVALDIANLAAGRALVDWKNDRVTEITDPFARQVLKIAIHEIKRIEPISVSVFGQSRRRDQTAVLSALTALLGYRPTLTEKDKREQEVLHRIYSLKGQQEKLYQYLGGLRNPRKAVENYNNTVKDILDSPMTPKIMKAKWEPKLIIDVERLLENKAYTLGGATQKPEDIERAVKYLKNFGVTQGEIEEYIRRKRAREVKKTPISPLDRDRVIGLMRRIRRAKERMGQ